MNAVKLSISHNTMIALRFLAVCFLLVFTFTPQANFQAAAAQQANLATMRIIINAPDALPTEAIPPKVSRLEAQHIASRLLAQYAAPVRETLDRLMAEGKVSSYTFLPDQFSFEVKTQSVDDLNQALGQSTTASRVAAVKPASSESSCAAQSSRKLTELVQTVSQDMARRTASELTAAQSAAAVANIRIRMDQPGIGDYFSGNVTPNKILTYVLKRGSATIASGTTDSDSDGYYYVYAPWQSCPTNGNTWSIMPGDEVIVNDTVAVYKTIAVSINGWLDPTQNVIYGKTEAGRAISVWLYAPKTVDACSTTGKLYNLNTDAAGVFTSALADFSRRSSATVYAIDAGGNYSYTYYDAFQMSIFPTGEGFNVSFYLKPQVAYTATNKRGGAVTETITGQTGPDGYANSPFTKAIAADDVVTVTGGGETMSYTYKALTAAVNSVANTVSGQFAAGYYISASHRYVSSSTFSSTCDFSGECASATPAANGSYTITFPEDLIAGDEIYITGWDAQGNGQVFGSVFLPVIVARLDASTIQGQWTAENINLTIRQKSSDGKLLEEKTDTTSSYGNNFYVNFSTNQVAAGQIIEVTDGTVTRTMIVSDLTASVPFGGSSVSGKTPAGYLVTEARDYHPQEDSTYTYCSAKTTAAGNYSTSFEISTNNPLKLYGRDLVNVTLRDAQENLTYQGAFLFDSRVQKDATLVEGNTALPKQTVTLVQTHSGAAQAAVTATSGDDRRFTMTAKQPLSPGDALSFSINDGTTVNTTVAPLTIQNNLTSGAAEGVTNPLWLAEIVLRRYSSVNNASSETMYVNALANSIGQYSLPYAGLNWYHTPCTAVTAGDPCLNLSASVTGEDGTQTFLDTAKPTPPKADQFEPADDAITGATPIAPWQVHSLHAATDIDWYKVTFDNVPQGGLKIKVMLRNAPWSYQQLKIALYHEQDTTTPVDEQYMTEDSSDWFVTLAQSGTYYISVEPTETEGVPCDSFYMIGIATTQLYLPSIWR